MSKISLILPLALVLLGCGQSAPTAADACPAFVQAGCPAGALSYDSGIGAVLEQRCTPCHAAGGVEATFLLTDYAHAAGLRTSIATQLLGCAMPPTGAPPLSNDERQQILVWLTCGAPR